MSDAGSDLKKISPDKLKKIRGTLQEISRIVTSNPAMSPPKGFEARFWGTISTRDRFDVCTGKNCPPTRPVATLAMMLGRYEDKGGTVKAAFNTPSTMDISINNLGHIFAHLPVLYKDAEGFLLPEPQADGERAGYKAFSNNGHAVAVITRNGSTLWQPVSRERYLKAAIDAAARDAGEIPPPPVKKGKKKPATIDTVYGKPVFIEEEKSWIDPLDEKVRVEKSRTLTFGSRDSNDFFRERVQKLRSELETMPQEERLMQARVDTLASTDEQSPPLLPAGNSTGIAVVTPDFRYFNTKLPIEAVQLIVIQWKFDGTPIFDPQKSDITENLNNQKLLEIYKSMEWQKLGAKVIRTGL